MADSELFDAIAEAARLKVQTLLIDCAETDPICGKVAGTTAFIALASGASAAIASLIHALVQTENVDGDAIIEALQAQLMDHWSQAKGHSAQRTMQ